MPLPLRSGAFAGLSAAHGAAAWSLLFALASFYWAAGGTGGYETIGPGLVSLARDPTFVVIGLWGAGLAKLGGAAVALGILAGRPRSWQRALAALSIVGGGLCATYGIASLIQHAAMVSGVAATPVALGHEAARWHLVLWDPWWVLGGVLFAAAGRKAWRSHP